MQRISPDRPHLPLPLLGTQATRALESLASSDLPPQALMQRAGAAGAKLALALAPHSPTYWVLAGPGNNGGDGLEAARWLHTQGHSVGVTLSADPARLPADARQALHRAETAGVLIQSDWPQLTQTFVIDALLGIGLKSSDRSLSSTLDRSLTLLRQHSGPILALDLPSGLSADTGDGLPWTVRATATLSLLTLKPGLFTGRGRDCAGEVWWDDLDIPHNASPTAWLSSETPIIPRQHAQHKGSFGDVVIVGGAASMTGAALLAARAAQAAGAGRVYVHLLACSPAATDPRPPLTVDIHSPSLMLRSLEATQRPAAWAQQTLVCGCGGGEAIADVLPAALSMAARLVVDADGLNAISQSRALQRQLQHRAAKAWPTILTPHPLEAARLLKSTTGEVQGDRLRAAQALAEQWGCVVVLKGSGTVIAAPQSIPCINLPGNAALASAGTGDVLAGWMGGWWAQAPHLPPQAVASQTVAWHGMAAEPAHNGPISAESLIHRMQHRLGGR